MATLFRVWRKVSVSGAVLLMGLGIARQAVPAEPTIKIPRFSVDYMDRSVDPSVDFYRFACGTWLKNNPVPSDKARWAGFDELQERNWQQIRGLLESAAADSGAGAVLATRQVGDFYASAMDTNRLEQLGLKPIQAKLARIAEVKTVAELIALLGELHRGDAAGLFNVGVSPDAKNSGVYAFHLNQGGLGLPDRDYYLTDGFAKERDKYKTHVSRMFQLLGESETDASRHAATVLDLETAMAKASKSRVELRDPNANYNKWTASELRDRAGGIAWDAYFEALGVGGLREAIVGQTNFIQVLGKLVADRPLAEWQTYLRWHLVHSAAPYLNAAAEIEAFSFYGTVLRGQPQQEPRWQRSARVIDGSIGEALGSLYVAKYFPPAAKARMEQLIGNLREVFKDRLAKLEWMSEPTRAKALDKFARFTQKVGHPDKFRDYSSVQILRDDYLGNVERAAEFEVKRELARVGKPVDKTEWHMTPQTVNAYFNPLQNEIVFPAGILQPPFFDIEADDAVNYGAIGVVIGHEITHGYDDQGRKYDADGNLNEWWTESDGKEFESRAKKVVDQYSSYEALPGGKVNGQLTLGENIADLGGTSVAYEALQRALAKRPSARQPIDGFTPEQRFFLSLSQVWRTNWREAELRRRLVTDPHSPGQFRAIGPHVNLQEFYDAFGIKPGAPMYRPPELRAKIW
jgi:putative endopeptidase